MPRARSSATPATDTLRRIVVASDGSAGAHGAAAAAAALPLARDARIAVVHVADPGAPAAAVRAASARIDEDAARLRRLLARGGRGDVGVEVVLGRGEHAPEIARLARDAGAELVVVGRRGHGRVRDLLLGTTAERVAELATMPVLIAGRAAGAAYARPMLALDGGPGATAVVEAALRVIDPASTRLRVVTAHQVFGEGWLWAGGTPTAEMLRLRARARETARRAVTRALLPAARRRLRVELTLREGDPRKVIADAVRRLDPDLLAIGATTKPSLGPLRLGRVAAHVLHTVACDLLVVPAPD